MLVGSDPYCFVLTPSTPHSVLILYLHNTSIGHTQAQVLKFRRNHRMAAACIARVPEPQGGTRGGLDVGQLYNVRVLARQF